MYAFIISREFLNLWIAFFNPILQIPMLLKIEEVRQFVTGDERQLVNEYTCNQPSTGYKCMSNMTHGHRQRFCTAANIAK